MSNVKEPIHFGLTTISQEFFQPLRDGCTGRDVISILGRSFVISSVSVADDPVMPQAKASFSEVTFQAWVGVGLPPVGTVCEYTGHKHGLKPGAHVEIIHHFNAGSADVAAFIYSQGPGMGRYVAQSIADNFRPIRTPEQIAAEEALLEIERLYSEGGPAAVFDAGYRKKEAK